MRPWSLRARLFVALCALALLPTLVFAWFTFVQLDRATARQYQSGVEEALSVALDAQRAAESRLTTAATERAQEWATALPALARDPSSRATLSAELRRAGLDFAQWVERGPDGWRTTGTIEAAGAETAATPALADSIDAALANERVLHGPAGELAAVAPLDSATALVVGVRFGPGHWQRVEELRRVRGMYARVGVLVDVQRGTVWLTVLALAAAIALGALLLASALAGGMTRPLSRLGAALEGVQDGATHEPLPETGPRELAGLAASFNAMTARLGEARAALARAEREAAWRDFARRLAHELKNPLTPMTLSIHRLQKRLANVPESDRTAVRDSLDALLEEVDHLARLAEKFAEHARLPASESRPLDLAELARTTAALHETSGASLQVESSETLPVRGDRLMLSRALHNLIVNACEAGGAASVVEVVTGGDAAEAWVEVRDRGTGIDPEFAERAFEPYVSTKQRGSGLGLALVRDVARQHGGRVTLVNREGGGAVARLTLPRLLPEGTP